MNEIFFPNPAIIFIMLLAIQAVGIFFYFKRGKPLAVKFLCSFLVFTYALSGVFIAGFHSAFPLLMVCGLLCCMIGDVFISFSFIWGMAAFAAAHICFIAGYIKAGLFTAMPIAQLIVFILLIAPFLYAILKLKLIKGELRFAACIYAALITFMTSLAVCSPALYGAVMVFSWASAIALGSVLFLLSDFMLGLMVSGRESNKLDYISLSFYYMAISLFGLSVNIFCP